MVPGVGPGGICTIDVDDCAEGHVLAEEKGRAGERYILTGHDVTLADFAAHIGRIAGVKVPRMRIPAALGVPVASLIEGMSRRTGKEPLVTAKEARFTAASPHFPNGKALRELGLTIRPLDDTLRRAVDWFRYAGDRVRGSA